jgi:two-component system, NarL family, response regulator DevR
VESSPIGLVIVDHHRVVREGVRAMVQGSSEIAVVGQAGSIADAVELVAAHPPVVVITGLDLLDGRGVDLVRVLRRTQPATRTIVLSPIADDELFFDAVVAGAVGFLVEDIEPDDLVASVLEVGWGGTLINPLAITRLREKMGAPRLPDALTSHLTGQEGRIVALVIEGATNAEVAARLSLAEKTVRNYMTNILAKTGARNRTELTASVVRSVSSRRFGEVRRVAPLPDVMQAG